MCRNNILIRKLFNLTNQTPGLEFHIDIHLFGKKTSYKIFRYGADCMLIARLVSIFFTLKRLK
jgi:hypothetical protein